MLWENQKATLAVSKLVTQGFLLNSKWIFKEQYNVLSKLLRAKLPLIEANLIACSVNFRTNQKKVLTFYIIRCDRRIFFTLSIERKKYCQFFFLFRNFFLLLYDIPYLQTELIKAPIPLSSLISSEKRLTS